MVSVININNKSLLKIYFNYMLSFILRNDDSDFEDDSDIDDSDIIEQRYDFNIFWLEADDLLNLLNLPIMYQKYSYVFGFGIMAQVFQGGLTASQDQGYLQILL